MTSLTSGKGVHQLIRVAAMMVWTGGIVAGLLAVAATLARPTRERRSARTARRLAGLRDAVLGNSKAAIAAVFGPPPTALIPAAAKPDASNLRYADTWYYPLDRRKRRAIVIQFEWGIAHEVEFIDVPINR